MNKRDRRGAEAKAGGEQQARTILSPDVVPVIDVDDLPGDLLCAVRDEERRRFANLPDGHKLVQRCLIGGSLHQPVEIGQPRSDAGSYRSRQ